MHRLHVIAVEDQEDLRSLWKIKFEFYGIPGKVLTPEEALRLPADEWKRADILITDWMLGGLTGSDIIKRALENNPTIKCHVLTALPYVDGLPIGTMFWIKPIPIETIIQEARRDND